MNRFAGCRVGVAGIDHQVTGRRRRREMSAANHDRGCSEVALRKHARNRRALGDFDQSQVTAASIRFDTAAGRGQPYPRNRRQD